MKPHPASTRSPRPWAAAFALLASLLVLAACGGGEDTPNAATASSGPPTMRALAIHPASDGGLILNEVHAANWKGAVDEDLEVQDWVEIYNPSADAVDLSGYGLSNKSASPFLWVFPAGAWVGPKSYVTLWLSKKDRAVLGAPLHANFNLDNGADSIFLTAPNGTAAGVPIDSATPALVKPDQSWCRMPSGSAASPFMVCSRPTFNTVNGGTARPGILAKPVISLASGFYASAVQVSLSGPAGAAIRFTTDGSEPTAASPLYTAPLSLAATTVLRAAAFSDTAESSLVETATYVIDAARAAQYAGLRAVLVAMPPGDFSRFQTNDKTLLSHAAFEMVTGGRTTVFKLDAEGSVAGQQGSLDSPQVSMNVTARDVFGPKAFNAVLWPEKPAITSTKKFRLRNGSNDWSLAHLRDQLSQSLGAPGPNQYASSSSVAMFVNGAYYGLMDLREREDETLAANNLAIDKDYVDDLFDPLLTTEIHNGGSAALDRYKTLYSAVATGDMSTQANYDAAKSLFNPEGLAWDWALHVFHGNSDWPYKNVHVWRSPEYDGRWNWHAHDMDYAFGRYQDATLDMNPSFSMPGSELVASLLRNAEFRDLYLNIVADQMNLMTPARMNARLDVMASEMRPYIGDFFAKNALGDEATWTGYVDQIRDYFGARPGLYDGHTRALFGLKNRGAINVAVNDKAMGTVKVNTLDVGALMSTNGPSWTGLYYPGVPIKLEARPRPGYAFVGWQGASTASTARISHAIATTGAVNPDGFSARWTGQVLAPASGVYRLRTVSNDGVRVWLNGVPVIDHWNVHDDATDTSTDFTLEAGQRHDITVEYFEATGGATMRLLWQPPGSSVYMPIPATHLFASASAALPAGLSAAYFNNQNLAGAPVAQAIEPVDFAWGAGAPTPSAAQFTAVFAPAGAPASPTVQPIPAQAFHTGDIALVRVLAADPGGFDLRYGASKLPKGLNIHPATGTIYGRITTPGIYNSTLSASNGVTSASVNVTWTVTDRTLDAAPAFVNCGTEGSICALASGALADVYYGANSMLSVKRNVRGNVACNSGNFGGDPAPNVLKNCFFVLSGQAGNLPPTVAITAPASGGTVAAGAPVTLSATAADADGSVASVEFFDGTTSLGVVNASPYRLTWTATIGTHAITARAFDDLGAQTTSAPVTLTVDGDASSVYCAPEGGLCVVPAGAAADVYFGAQGRLAVRHDVVGGIACGSGAFGGDPAPNVLKSCSYVITSQGGNAPPTVSLTSPAANSNFTAGDPVTLTANAADTDGSVVSVEFFDGATSMGSVSAAPYTLTWTSTIGSHSLTARATDNGGAQTISAAVVVNVNGAGAPIFCAKEDGTCALPANAFADVYYGANGKFSVKHNVTGSIACRSATFGGDPAPGVFKACSYVITDQGSNIPPTVSLTAPSSGATFAAGAPVTLSATAADSDGSVTKVEFFDGATSLGGTSVAPYRLTWTATIGAHVITARATDNTGAQTTSAGAAVTVEGDSSTVYCAPEGGQCAVPAGAAADVYFGANGRFAVKHNVVGTVGCNSGAFGGDPAPNVLKACTYVITSQSGNAPPTVSLTAPAANSSFTAGDPVTISAAAADSDGGIATVEFFDGTTLLGGATAAPYAVTWASTIGAHSLTARATDNAGAQTTSAAVVINVNGVGAPIFCAKEDGICTLPAGAIADVYFGANGNFAVRHNVTTRIACTNAVFGDPAPNVLKSCSYVVTGP